jgi:flagellar assembly protein FliH
MSSSTFSQTRVLQGDSAQSAAPLVWPVFGPPVPSAPERAWQPGETGGAHNSEPPPEPAASQEFAACQAELATVQREMAAAVEHARQQGRTEGQRLGEQQGREQALAQVEPVMARLLRTIEDLSATRDAFRREAEEDIVRLSLGIARRVVHREVSIDHTVLVGVIRAALDKIGARELHRVLVSPGDQAAIAAGLDSLKLNRRIDVVADANLERGAVLFETIKGSLDASLETQLDEIERGLIDALDRRGK